jgi:hypothetical protein
VRAMLDESVPLVRGHYAYVVVATVLMEEDPVAIKAALGAVVANPGRRTPFHWHQEGEEVRGRMVRCLIDLGASAHVVVHYPTGRRRQEAARRAAIEELLPVLLHEGVTDLVIESRGPDQDRHDRATLLEGLHALGDTSLAYDWGTKSTQSLWLPDAVCGAVSMFLADESDPTWYDQLRDGGVITKPIYIAER